MRQRSLYPLLFPAGQIRPRQGIPAPLPVCHHKKSGHLPLPEGAAADSSVHGSRIVVPGGPADLPVRAPRRCGESHGDAAAGGGSSHPHEILRRHDHKRDRRLLRTSLRDRKKAPPPQSEKAAPFHAPLSHPPGAATPVRLHLLCAAPLRYHSIPLGNPCWRGRAAGRGRQKW